MQSIRSKIIIWLVKNRHLFELKLKPEIIDENFSVDKFREGVNKVTSKMKMPKEVPMITTERAYTSPIWYTPKK